MLLSWGPCYEIEARKEDRTRSMLLRQIDSIPDATADVVPADGREADTVARITGNLGRS